MHVHVCLLLAKLKSLLALQTITQGGITKVDKCLCKFMTRILPELNLT